MIQINRLIANTVKEGDWIKIPAMREMCFEISVPLAPLSN